METEEIAKRIEWLESERKKDKQMIIDLTSQVEELTDKLAANKTALKGLESSVKRVSLIVNKTDEFEDTIAKQKVEFANQYSTLEKKLTNFEKKVDKLRKDDADAVTKKLIDFQNEIKTVGEIRKTIQDRTDSDYRMNQKIEGLSKQIQELKTAYEEAKRFNNNVDDNQKTDSKRISDIQVELNVLRKKIEEARNADDVQSEFLKKIETRVNDLVNLEQLRKQEQISFIETQSRISVDYEKKWREWETKFDQLEEIRQRLQNQLLEMEGTNRSAKQSVAEFEEMNQKLDRRINEITEINRLTEDRFRQDWVSFKVEDQKRWTNYALMQEEQNRERDRDYSHLEQQTSEIEENVQKLMDLVNAVNEETQKGMKAILSLSNELLSSYEKAIFKRK